MSKLDNWRNYGMSHWRRHLVPILVWLIAAGGAGWLFIHRAQRCELVGIAQGEQRQVAALTNGRLRIVPVQLFEQVKQGQPLAVFQDDKIQSELVTAAAAVVRLREELSAAENRLLTEAKLQETEQMAETGKLVIGVEKHRLRKLELQVVLEADRITLEFLRIQMELMGDLYEKRAVSEIQFRSAQTEHAALEKKIKENEKVLVQVKRDLEKVLERQEAFAWQHATPPALDKVLAPFRAALTVQERRVGELFLNRSMLVLTSPMDGVVSEVLRGVGEAIMAGEPILTVTVSQPSEVIVYATPAQVGKLGAGTAVRVQVTRPGSSKAQVQSKVIASSPTARQLPMQLWRNPSVAEWGWPVKIALPSELGVLCGELVGVQAELL